MLSSSYRPVLSTDSDEYSADNPFNNLEANFSTFPENEIISHPNKSSKSNNYYKYIIASIGVALMLLMVISFRASTNSTTTSSMIYKSIDLSTESSYVITVTAAGDDYGTPNSVDMLPWDTIIEPHRSNSFQIASFIIDEEVVTLTDSDYTVTWTIDGTTYTGSEISVTPEKTGLLLGSVSIVPLMSSSYYGKRLKSASSLTTPKRKLRHDYDATQYSASISSSYDLSFTIGSKYVRREIRDLTDDDRNVVIDAMKMLYALDDVSGQALYGEKYHSAEYFATTHLNGGGRTDCDHWHDGAGIAVVHVAFTLEYEQTLQAINPKIALPYWEYSKDSYLYDDLSESPIFNSDWFGEMNPQNGDHTLDIGDSIWNSIQTPKATSDKYTNWDISSTGSLNPYSNAYGHMGSPWNNNPSAYIGRSNTTYGRHSYSSYPSCSTLYDAFSQGTLMSMNDYLNGQTHGPTHIMVGGAWTSKDDATLDDFEYLKKSWKILFFKVLWRMGITRCPSECSDTSSCRCAVPSEYIDEYGAYSLLESSYILYPIMAQGYIDSVSGQTDDFYTDILKAIEHPGAVGEMYSSNAAWDPLFWLVHGTMERLLSFKRSIVSQGDATFDETWGFTEWSKTSGDIYLNGRCDWSGVSSVDDLTLPTCSTESTCSGHNEDDTLSFSNFLGTGDTYTNGDFYDFMHPWNDDNPYIYETMTYDYCNEYDGIDFLDGITDSLKFKGYSSDYLKSKTAHVI